MNRRAFLLGAAAVAVPKPAAAVTLVSAEECVAFERGMQLNGTVVPYDGSDPPQWLYETKTYDKSELVERYRIVITR